MTGPGCGVMAEEGCDLMPKPVCELIQGGKISIEYHRRLEKEREKKNPLLISFFVFAVTNGSARRERSAWSALSLSCLNVAF